MMASSSGSAPPGGSNSTPNQTKRSSSKLDILLEKLHNTADSSGVSSDPRSSRSGSSRRKPTVIRKFMESEENTDDNDDEYIDNGSVEMNGNAVDSPNPGHSKVNGDDDGEEPVMEMITVDEQGNPVLLDGTMVVQPEAVVEKKGQFKGPEFAKSRKRNSKDLDKVTCTGCHKQVNPNIRKQVRRHPVLKVIICKACYDYYTSDEIDQDSDGMDEQCRWCGNGGNLICCDYCHNAFCRGCIKRNLGRAELSSIDDTGEDDKWRCYVCNSKPLKKLVQNCNEVLQFIDEVHTEEKKSRDRDKRSTQGQSKGKGKNSNHNQKSSSSSMPNQNAPSGGPGSPIFQQYSDYEINTHNVKPVLDRLMAVTTSMQMFLTSLDSDYKNHGKKVEIQVEVTKKLKRAMVSYKKLFTDIELFARGSNQSKTSPQVKKNSPSQVVNDSKQRKVNAAPTDSTSKPTSVGKESHSRTKRLSLPKEPIVIELSDISDDEPAPPKKSIGGETSGTNSPTKQNNQVMKTEKSFTISTKLKDENDTKGEDAMDSIKSESTSSISNSACKREVGDKTREKESTDIMETKTEETAMDVDDHPDSSEDKTKDPSKPNVSGEKELTNNIDNGVCSNSENSLKNSDQQDVSTLVENSRTDQGNIVDDLPSADKDVEDYNQGDFISVYRAALDAEVNKDSQLDENETFEQRVAEIEDDIESDSDLSMCKIQKGKGAKKTQETSDTEDTEAIKGGKSKGKGTRQDASSSQGQSMSSIEKNKSPKAKLKKPDKPSDSENEQSARKSRGKGKKNDSDSEDEHCLEKRSKSKGKKATEYTDSESDSEKLTKKSTEKKNRLDENSEENERKSKASGMKRKGEEIKTALDIQDEKPPNRNKRRSGQENEDADSDDTRHRKSKVKKKQSSSSESELSALKTKGLKNDSESEDEHHLAKRSKNKGKKTAEYSESESDDEKDLKKPTEKVKSAPDSDDDKSALKNKGSSKGKNNQENEEEDSDGTRYPKGKGKGKGKSSAKRLFTETEEKEKGKRSRDDMEAQRTLLKELRDTSDEEDETENEESDVLVESSNSEEKNDSDYEPHRGKKQIQKDKKLSRIESAKKKTQDKFKALREKRESEMKKRRMKEKKETESRRKKRKDSDDSSDDDEDERRPTKKPKKKTVFDELSDTDTKGKKKKSKAADSDQGEEKVPVSKKTKKKKRKSDSESEGEKSVDPKSARKNKTEIISSGDSEREDDTDDEKLQKLSKSGKIKKDTGETKSKKSKTESKKQSQNDKDNSDTSEGYDSDLENMIEKLASLPKKHGQSRKEKKADCTEEKVSKKAKESTPDKSVRLSRKMEKEKGVDIDMLGSGSSSDNDIQPEEDMTVDQDMGSEDEQETIRKLTIFAEKAAADRNARRALLASDSDSELSPGTSDDEDTEKGKKKRNKKAKEPSDGTSDSSEAQLRSKKRLKQTALLNAKLSDSEESEAIEGKKSKAKSTKKKNSDDEEFVLDEEEENDEEGELNDINEDESDIASVHASDSDVSVGKKKKKKKKKKGKKDSDEEVDSEDGKKKKSYEKTKGKRKRKRIKAMSDSSEETEDSDAPKPKSKKRKKKKKGSGDEEEEEAEEGSDNSDDEATPGKKRKNIKKLIKDKKLSQDTKTAAKAEEERRKRITDRQKLYNLVQEEREEDAGQKIIVTTKLVLESKKTEDEEGEGKPIIEVHKDIINKLKPHQVEAVKFLWDCLVESLDRLKKEDGAGCILAHCMGLGKTLSMISFIHTLLTNSKKTKQRTCIVVCPLNTVLNWEHEFEKWQPEDAVLDVYELTTVKDNWGRADRLKDWQEGGGILIMGYEMYRNLSQCKRVRNKKQKKIFFDTLVEPGPDLVVCDEGHILKNDKSSTSIAMNGIRTKRRVVLTGTPLQNNLGEYHCMVNFVKPSLLGTRKEFSNRFVNPITNGQCANASKWDVKLMKKRAHILHETLAGCVQRRDYAALTKFLPPKHEYILSIRLSSMQCDLYAKYLDIVGRSGTIEKGDVRGASLFSDYQNLSRIWTHPWILRLHEVREQNKKMFDDEDSFLDDDESDDMDSFIDDSDSASDGSDQKWGKKKKSKRGQNNEEKEDKAEPKAGTSSGKRGSDRDSDVEIVKKWNTRSRGRDGNDSDVTPPEPVTEKETKLSREWWAEFVSEGDQYKLELSGKLSVLAEILKMSEAIGDKVLVFSQSLLSLDLIEDFLEHWDKAVVPENPEEQVAGQQTWTHGIDYFRMDGSTNSALRKRWSEIFNDRENPRARLFLISTKAGSLGTNMVGANRCIIFDASWNPTHDVQSIFRVYRFGQTKPVYIYRFLAQGTMEEKIYERQVTKQSLSSRVVDEHQIERHFTAESLQELYNFTPDRLDDPNREERPTPVLPKDRMLAEMLTNQKTHLVTYHEHDSLLENQIDEELSEEDRKAAWEEYEAEKKGLIQRVAMPNYQQPRMPMNPYGPMMGGPQSMSMFPHLTEVARAIRNANPNVSMAELQQRLEHYMRLQMASQQQVLYQQQQQHMQRYGAMPQQMMGGPEPGEVTFMGYGNKGQEVNTASSLYSVLNGSKKE